MSEFVSRWLTPSGSPEKTPETTKSRTDGTDRSAFVSSVSTAKEDLGGFPPPGPFAPLDPVIAGSEASRRSLAEIEARLSRLTATAARQEATPLDRQLVADWRAIRDAKLAGG